MLFGFLVSNIPTEIRNVKKFRARERFERTVVRTSCSYLKERCAPDRVHNSGANILHVYTARTATCGRPKGNCFSLNANSMYVNLSRSRNVTQQNVPAQGSIIL